MFFLLLFGLNKHVVAQHKNTSSTLPAFKATPLFFPVKYFSANNTVASFMKPNRNIEQPNPLLIKSGSINDMPFFCSMECKVRKRTNIWIKLRAGNDESYRKMIQPSK